MDTETFLKAAGLLILFVGLLFSAAKNKRDAFAERRKCVLDDILVLKELKPGSFYHKRIEARLRKSILQAYPPHKLYYFWLGLFGLLAYLGGGLYGSYLATEKSWWAIFFFFLAIIGFEFQKRSLLPGFEEGPPEVELTKDAAR